MAETLIRLKPTEFDTLVAIVRGYSHALAIVDDISSRRGERLHEQPVYAALRRCLARDLVTTIASPAAIKGYVPQKPVTHYSITDKGREAVRLELDRLADLIDVCAVAMATRHHGSSTL